MTIIYTKKITTSGYYGGFFQFLCRWKGSVYKSVWKDVLFWLLVYYILRVIYTGMLSEEGRKLLLQSEMALKYRLAIMRYIHLGVIICMQTLSTRAEKHFGELEDLLDEQCPSCRSKEGKSSHPGSPCIRDKPGYIPRMLTEEEKDILEDLGRVYGSEKPPYWIPLVWACRVAEEARSKGLVGTSLGLQSIISEIRGVRTRLGQCRDMENINIPLVYTQVVTMGCYTWWIVSLIASQFIEQDGMDIYFPIFSVLQLVFFMGWLKVAEMLINPFGEDEDDFDVDDIVERNIKIPFPVLGSLNGCWMYSRSLDCSLLSASSNDGSVTWQEFDNFFVLILIVKDGNILEEKLRRSMLDLVYSALVLSLGSDLMSSSTSVEKLKREMRSCYRVIDLILRDMAAASTASSLATICLKPFYSPYCPDDLQKMKTYLESFCGSFDIAYGCMLHHGVAVACTDAWRELLSSHEALLLSIWVRCLQPISACDTPLFLPHKSPKVPFRLLCFRLIGGEPLHLCLLCGSTPNFSDVLKQINPFWRPHLQFMKGMKSQFRSLTFKTDPYFLGFVLLDEGKNWGTVQVEESDEDGTSAKEKIEALRSFHIRFSPLLDPPTSDSGEIPVSETYEIGPVFACYALNVSPFRMYALFKKSITPHHMRVASRHTLEKILKSKLVT
ncbi:unnamed protein product [Darwinula stevensoni]|uniref:Bestrophin homolog n=1 Tax=Darwinula stevensoni TaxID=69355 RepID=A0A7R8X3F1_9CRUS|nr:unnamed protein product [Darwinula stevensoni]CAG0882292.1 unnamed protein product [Darwinula stevensoni]